MTVRAKILQREDHVILSFVKALVNAGIIITSEVFDFFYNNKMFMNKCRISYVMKCECITDWTLIALNNLVL